MAKSLLLADDSTTIQKVVELCLGQEHITVVAAKSADEALTRARDLRPDIIVADVFMPGKSGYDLAAAVRADPGLQHIPVLLLQSLNEPFDENRARASGANGWIPKPFQSQILIDNVKQLLSAKPAQTAPAPARPAPAAQPAAVSAVGQRVPTQVPPAKVPAPLPPAAARPAVAGPSSKPPAPAPAAVRPPTPGPAAPPRPPAPAAPAAAVARPAGTPGPAAAPRPPAAPAPAAVAGVRPPAPAGTPRPPGALPTAPPRPPGAPAPAGAPRTTAPTPGPIAAGKPGVAAPAPRPPGAPAPAGAPRPPAQQLTAQNHEALLREALTKASREMIEKVIWEVVPELAETMIKEELARLVKAREAK